MKTFFCLVNIPKTQQKGDASKPKVYTTETKSKNTPKWDGPEPLYKTEGEVTTAIATNSFKPSPWAETTNKAYDRAKAWQKYQKAIQPHPFKAKVGAKNLPNGKYNHVMFGAH